MILSSSLAAPLVLVVVGVILYALLGQMPEPSRPLVTVLSTVLVVVGVLYLVVNLLSFR